MGRWTTSSWCGRTCLEPGPFPRLDPVDPLDYRRIVATTRSRPKPTTRGVSGSTATTDEFFRRLHERGHEPTLTGDSGGLRFDVSRGPQVEHWYVTIADGAVSVSHSRSRADCVVKLDGQLFDQLISGTANAVAAHLRGDLIAEGDLHLFMVFQRLFPGPPRSSQVGRPAGTHTSAGSRR